MPSDPTIKFLLVDDLDANLIALEGLLKRDGLELLKATSGPAALELLLSHDIALALVDVQMPDMSGFELAELMRSTEKTRRIPIIFLTAGVVDQQRRIRGYETGAVDFLPKPIDPANLINKADVFYELAKQRNELQQNERRLRQVNDQLERSNAELARADRSKDEFLALLAHELRTPLAPLRTGLDILKNHRGDTDESAVIGTLERQVDQIVRLVDDLLDVSRITNGKLSLDNEPVSLEIALDYAVEATRTAFENRGHHLSVHKPAVALWVSGDQPRLIQIFSNLLNNAAKYTDNGGTIEVDVRTEDGLAVVSVKDNGEGIDPEMQEAVFRMFGQVGHENKPPDGLGIGLSLVKSLISMHQGTIELVSEGRGKGSEFIVRLPTVAAPAGETAEVLPAGPIAETTGPRSVLVVDDGVSAADILTMFLNMEGLRATAAYDGFSALENFRSRSPDIIFSDIGMPGMDGHELARAIRKSPGGDKVLLVALTGWGQESDQLKSKESGFDFHLTKPVDPATLRSFLKDISVPS